LNCSFTWRLRRRVCSTRRRGASPSPALRGDAWTTTWTERPGPLRTAARTPSTPDACKDGILCPFLRSKIHVRPPQTLRENWSEVVRSKENVRRFLALGVVCYIFLMKICETFVALFMALGPRKMPDLDLFSKHKQPARFIARPRAARRVFCYLPDALFVYCTRNIYKKKIGRDSFNQR